MSQRATASHDPRFAVERKAIFGALLQEEILEEVGDAQGVLTIPKLLRPYFLHHRELVGEAVSSRLENSP